jgi:TonB family protein
MSISVLLLLGFAIAHASGQPPDAQAPIQPVRVQGSISEPKKTKDVAPDYPDDAIRAGLTGTAVLECEVDTKGTVTVVRILSGVPPLTDAATKAVKKWRYTPLRLNGTPTPFVMTTTVTFGRLTLRLNDLLHSLKNKNEYIREAAVVNLGTYPGGGQSSVARQLKSLAEHDESERVRVAALRAVAQLEGK